MTGLFLLVSFLLGFGLSWLYMVRSVTRTMPAQRAPRESAATRYYRRRGASPSATRGRDRDDRGRDGHDGGDGPDDIDDVDDLDGVDVGEGEPDRRG